MNRSFENRRYAQRGHWLTRLAGTLLILLLVGGLFALGAIWLVRPVATGYAAKVMCSGLWVSGLPQTWLQNRVIAPALQPASAWLDYEIDDGRRQVRVSLAGFSQSAHWRSGMGCTLIPLDGSELVLAAPVREDLSSDPLAEPDVESETLAFGGTELRFAATDSPDVLLSDSQSPAPDVVNPESSVLDDIAERSVYLSPQASLLPPLAEPPQPGRGWVSPVLPEGQQQAINAILDEAFSEPQGYVRKTLAIVVSWKGQRIAARYRAPVSARTPMPGWSMTKSLLSTWVGIRQQQGGLTLQEPVSRLWPQLEPTMTLENLLRMESGLAFREWYLPSDEVTTMLYQKADMAAFAATQPATSDPAETWSYSSGDNILAASQWTASLPDSTAWRLWLDQQVWKPLGITDAMIEADGRDLPVTSSYSYMSADSWMKIGQLWLDAWHDRSPLLPPGWMKAAVTPATSNREGNYGLGFWLNRGSGPNSAQARWPQLPASLFWARGHDGQYVLVMPEQELVVVRLGLTPGEADGVETLLFNLLDTLTLSAEGKAR
jgi:CubicO group peptidase (beta-lactamase class C family)